MSYDLTLGRMAMIKKSMSNKCERRCEEKGNLLHSWWACKLVIYYGEQYGGSSEN